MFGDEAAFELYVCAGKNIHTFQPEKKNYQIYIYIFIT
jgi:hypothetical protein